MSIELEVIKVGDEDDGILREDLSGIQEKPHELKEMAVALEMLCQQLGGAGLAASQAGLRRNFFVMVPQVWLHAKEPVPGGVPRGTVYVNPRWTAVGSEKETQEEGCLSLPGRKYQITRPAKIKAVWQTLNGVQLTRVLTGMPCRCFQHETDHLRGVCLDQKKQ
jgi:peptide deformylase